MLLCLLFAILAVEAVTRTKLFRASKDLSRFSEYPARAQALCAAPGMSIAFVGNSATQRGVDPEEVGRELGVTADVFAADASHVNAWFWILEREFYKQHLAPDLVVVTFFKDSLEDGKPLDLGRTAQFFTDPTDWPELFASDVTTLDGRADVVLSSFWATYAVRDRIKERTLRLLPRYEPYTQIVNDVTYRYESAKATRPPPTHHALARLLRHAKTHQTKLLFVAFPTQSSYEPSADARAMIEDAGQSYLDLRVVPGLEKRHYRDDVHLNDDGKALYTHHLAAAIRPVLR